MYVKLDLLRFAIHLLLFPMSPSFSVVLSLMNTAQHFSRLSATVLSCSLLQRDFYIIDPFQQQKRTGSNFKFRFNNFLYYNHTTQKVQEG